MTEGSILRASPRQVCMLRLSTGSARIRTSLCSSVSQLSGAVYPAAALHGIHPCSHHQDPPQPRRHGVCYLPATRHVKSRVLPSYQFREC